MLACGGSHVPAVTLDELEAFVCLAQLRSFTAASHKLARTQPAITRRLAKLERTLGAKLLDRRSSRVELTEPGRALLGHAEAAIAAARDGVDAVRELLAPDGDLGAVSLAIVGTLADSHLVAALRGFEKRFPATTVELRTATSAEVSALVRSGEVDIGLRYLGADDPQLEMIPLGVERLAVVVPASHSVRAARVRSLQRFGRDRWLAFPRRRGQPEAYSSLLERSLVRAGLADASVTVVDSLTAQKRLIEAGLGVALMPESSVRDELRSGSLRAIELVGMDAEIPVLAVRRRRGHRRRLAIELCELVKAHVPGLSRSRGRSR